VGGAIISRNRPVTITDSTITGNHAASEVAEFSGAGGGIGMYGSTLSITGTTISFNTAGYKGGGIFNYGSNVTITNSTISGNSADVNGGGFYTHYSSNNPVAIRHSTITGNTVQAAGSGGGIYRANGASSTHSIVHTIVAGNLRGTSTRDDLDGSFNVQFSLIGDDTGATINNQGGNLIGTAAAPIDPMLGPLADNGGPTFTHSPLLGSKAINAGNAAAVAGSGGVPQFDQRGTPNTRVFGGRIDIGSIEFQSPVSPLSLVVDIATDEHDGNVSAGDLSLREALAIANTNFGVVDAISFAGSLSGATLNLTLGALPISDPVNVTGLGADLLTVNASTNSGNRIFNIDDNNAGTSIAVALEGLTLTGANVTGDGGAIRNTESLTFARMAISGNSATGLGGGVKNEQGNLTVSDSTISGNSAATGGGIWTDTDLATKSTTIKNSTISGNAATASGGGVFNSDGLVVIAHSTITNNSAAAGAGSGVGSTGNAATRTEVLRTIISGNVNSDLDLFGGGTNSFQSNGFNLVGSTAASMVEFVETGDIINSNPMLEGLANNGGPTMTHLLMDDSPARDAGGMATAGSGGVPLFDQRGAGFDRVLGSQIDIGAVELPEPVTPVPELSGDYNRDEVVDAADFVMWVKTFGLTVPQYDGADGNGDTMVDDDDYPIWTENFGETLPPGAGGGAASMSASYASQVAGSEMATFISPSVSLEVLTKHDRPQHAGSRAVLAEPTASTAAHDEQLLLAIKSAFAMAGSEASDLDDQLSSDSHGNMDREAVDELFGEISEGPVLASFGL
jgi:hypothetical protein